VVGATLWYWLTNLLWEIGFSIRDEQDMGTLEQLWLTPAPRWLLILGNALTNTVVNSAMCLALGNSVVMALVGVTFPLAVLPGWAGALGKAIPLTWALKVMRGILLEGMAWDGLWRDLVVLATFAVVTPALGFLCFMALERSVRRKGTLGEY